MFIVTWKYDVMEGKNRQDLTDAAKADASDYVSIPGLIRKSYCVSPDCKSVVEFYLWKTKADADKFFGHEWNTSASRRWESAPMTRQDYEAPVVVESEQKRVIAG